MQKVLFFLSALIAVSAGQQLFNHVVVYTGSSCADSSIIFITSSPTTSCPTPAASVCVSAPDNGVTYYGRTICGDRNAVPNGDFGTIFETYNSGQCNGNTTTRIFFKNNMCVPYSTTGAAGSARVSCSGNRDRGTVSFSTCTDVNCANCVSASIDGGVCLGASIVSTRYYCGYSAASTAVVSVAALVLAALAAILF